MTKHNPPTPLLFLFTLAFLFSISISPVLAETDYSIYDLNALPTQVAAHLMINVFTAGLICSAVLFIICLLPMTIVTRSKRSSWIPELCLSLILLGFCVAMTWLPIFFIIAPCIIIALMFSGKMRDLITGK